MTTDEKNNYFKELENNLRRGGVAVRQKEDGTLAVNLDGKELCQITGSGGVRYWKDDVVGDARSAVLSRVTDIAKTTAEYTRLMAAAPQLTASSLEGDFRLLADFNHVVLAGHPTKYGIQFITWERSPDQTSLGHGHYYGPDGCVDNYTIAKQDFVTRSGLANCNAFLTPDQLTEVYRSICETLESGEPLTEKRKKRLEFAARKIEQGIPDLWARVELSIQNEQELNHMQLPRDEGIQFT